MLCWFAGNLNLCHLAVTLPPNARCRRCRTYVVLHFLTGFPIWPDDCLLAIGMKPMVVSSVTCDLLLCIYIYIYIYIYICMDMHNAAYSDKNAYDNCITPCQKLFFVIFETHFKTQIEKSAPVYNADWMVCVHWLYFVWSELSPCKFKAGKSI